MSLFTATLSVGLFLALLGAAFISGSRRFAEAWRALPRSDFAAYVLFGAASAWFLWRVAEMSPADMVVPVSRTYYVGFFAFIAVGSLLYVREFLAVRGLAALILLAAGPLLAAGYIRYGLAVAYKVPVFLLIFAAIYLGALPYRLRDFNDWLLRMPGRSRAFGGALALYGAALAAVAFSY